MALTFQDLQVEVKRRGILNQSGTQYDVAIKNIINSSLFRISRDALWRPLRRMSSFDTISKYSTGSGAGTFTNNSKNITVTGATFITDGIRIGRRIKLSGDGTYHTIKTITGETTLTIEKAYSGSTTSTGTYSILAQEEYVLPVQVGHKMFIWHEAYGFPFMLTYLPDQEFYRKGAFNTLEAVPTHYRMWGENMVNTQLLEPSVVTISSSSSSDQSIQCTIFGIVSGYPDYEIITTNATNGTTAVSGSKIFSSVERIVKSSSSIGRITVTGNSGNAVLSVLPVGDTTAGITYSKLQLWPLPQAVYPVNIQYYKQPYRLVNDGDVHELGQEFDEAIILLSTAKIKMENNQQEGDKFMLLYQDEIKTLKATNVDKIDWIARLKSPTSKDADRVVSNLLYQQVGAQFGPSRY